MGGGGVVVIGLLQLELPLELAVKRILKGGDAVELKNLQLFVHSAPAPPKLARLFNTKEDR